ncbi:MAG: ComEC/Rec2 family competence protein [Epsilonproteobacteria bacterium]|nr:ComEC/Rec2 family competence protein [Campylobacterota bacterium]
MLQLKTETVPYALFLLLAHLACGIFWQATHHTLPTLLTIPLLALTALLCIHFYKTTHTTQLILLCWLFFGSGATLYQLQKNNRKQLQTKLCSKTFDITGHVTNIEFAPSRTEFHTIEVATNNLRDKKTNQQSNASFSIICYTKQRVPVHVGENITVENVTFSQPKTTTSTGNPSYDDYLAKEGFFSSVFLNKENNIIVLKPAPDSLSVLLWNIKNNVYQALRKKLCPKTLSYFGLIFLGNKKVTHADLLRQYFNYWGLSHFLARSGLHILLFVLLWQWILSFIPVHIHYKRIFLITLCSVYHVLSWASVSMLRSLYVFLLLCFGNIFSQHTNFLHLLSLTCMLMLLFNPLQLFFLDFQLTFSLTFALALFMQTKY